MSILPPDAEPTQSDETGPTVTDDTGVEAPPAGEAVFADAGTPVAAQTVANDPAPAAATVDDAEAAYVEHVGNVTEQNAATAPQADSDAGPVESAPEPEVTSQPMIGAHNDPIVDAEVPLDTDPTDAPPVASPSSTDDAPSLAGITGDPVEDTIAEIHHIVKAIERDIDSLRVLVGELGPTFEAIVKEAKEKGLTGLIPMIFAASRGK